MLNPEHAPQYACMLVDLDSILDTRLGTIAKFGTEAYGKVIQMGYYQRKSDHFFGIDPVKYRELYRERDAVTLSGSMITHVVSLIKDFCTRVNITSHTAPIQRVPRIDINTYPYKIPDSVMELIIKAIHVHINEKADIHYVHYSPEDLHYDLVKFTYDHIVMYDISPWLNAQAEDWERRNKGMPEVTVFFPALHQGEKISDIPEDITELADDVTRMLAPIINPMQLPIQMFCSVFDPFTIAKKSPETKVPSDRSEVK